MGIFDAGGHRRHPHAAGVAAVLLPVLALVLLFSACSSSANLLLHGVQLSEGKMFQTIPLDKENLKDRGKPVRLERICWLREPWHAKRSHARWKGRFSKLCFHVETEGKIPHSGTGKDATSCV